MSSLKSNVAYGEDTPSSTQSSNDGSGRAVFVCPEKYESFASDLSLEFAMLDKNVVILSFMALEGIYFDSETAKEATNVLAWFSIASGRDVVICCKQGDMEYFQSQVLHKFKGVRVGYASGNVITIASWVAEKLKKC